MHGDELLTLDSVAAEIRQSRRSVERAIVRGDLATVQVGLRGVRVLRADLDEYLSRRRVPARDADQDVGTQDVPEPAGRPARTEKAADATGQHSKE